tara:strand:+ start:37 stop:345 length:309 start_codon:yes stop_codon:yes gene_type:complete
MLSEDHQTDDHQIDDQRLKKIEEKLDFIIEHLIPKCNKMSDHIDFVEDVYDQVKAPMNTFCDYIESARSHINSAITASPVNKSQTQSQKKAPMDQPKFEIDN